ncbi:MAG TPA: hypothetical protein V6C52_04505 [Coleofasciculaceae cyanobacterium]|jgi:hypothetical protein
MSIHFGATLSDDGFLSELPPKDASAFREQIQKLPEYLTIRMAERRKGDTWEQAGLVRVDSATVEEFRDIADVPDSRGYIDTIRPKSSILGRKQALKRYLMARRCSLMESVLYNASQIMNNVEIARAMKEKYSTLLSTWRLH